MEYEDTFKKDTFYFFLVVNQPGQSMSFKENVNTQFKSLCLTTFLN